MELEPNKTDSVKNYYIESPSDDSLLLKNLWLTIFHYQNLDSETWNNLIYDYTKNLNDNDKAYDDGVVISKSDRDITIKYSNGKEKVYDLVTLDGITLSTDLFINQQVKKKDLIFYNEKEVQLLKSRVARTLNEKTITWNTLMRGVLILNFKAIKLTLTYVRKNGRVPTPIVIPVNEPRNIMTSFTTQKLDYESFDELIADLNGAISTTYELLCRLFRAIIYTLNITPQFIDKKLTQMALDESKTEDSISKGRTLSSIKNNTMKILLKDRFTWDGFIKGLHVLGFKKARLTLTLINKNGDIQNYDLDIPL